uniref:Reverse transcriptase domain-containing protein n=1 Tax=Kryptolebias marmoratus TaxID=37003 RepID=A0A3Q3BNZ9_KRYMA
MSISPLKLVTFNVKGLNSPIKRKRVYTYLKKLKPDIVYLQETHLSDREHKKLKREWVGQVFFSSFSSKSRGTTILIHKNVPFTATKTISDPSGRYIMVQGQMYSESWTFMNIYAPNYDDSLFIQDVFLQISQAQGFLVVGGDFNFCLDTVLDRSSDRPCPLSKSAKTTTSFMEDLQLTDAWRWMHPQDREYSFYSHPHNTYTRIDNFLISSQILHRVMGSEYLPRLLSDHSPLVMSASIPDKVEGKYRWRLNLTLLKQPEFCTFIREQINFFILTNKPSAPSIFIFWDTLKAFLRGQIISYTKGIKKKYNLELNTLERQISDLEKIYQISPTKDMYRDLVNLKLKYNNMNTYQAERAIIRSKQQFYEFGEKTQKVLAWQLKTEENKRTINAIENPQKTITYNPGEINEAFKKYYSDLYTSQSQGDLDEIESFLSLINLPCLSEEGRDNLDKPFLRSELLDVIKSLPGNKSPGEDGFPSEFYKEFQDLLVPLLMDVLEQGRREGSFPDSFAQAVITVIYKKGKDPLKCSSYRPISLLNTDYKLVTKMIAKRLERFLPLLINPDQTGFILNRFSTDNLRRLLNIIHIANKKKIPSVAVSLDAEKAFDMVEWKYLFSVLKKFGFGDGFLNLIQSLYNSPQARVVTNGIISDSFRLFRGNRQGDPVSPALFVLAIEPLGEAIRINSSISGFEIGTDVHKISLFADDIILFLTNPERSLYHLQDLLDKYSSFSGYKVNLEKSEVLPISVSDHNKVKNMSNFKWSPEGFKYLGVFVDGHLKNLFKLNLASLLQKVSEDLGKWMDLPLTLFGRINVIKMNILPRFLYMFQSLPIHIPNVFFSSLKKSIRKFIWHGKPPRLSLDKLSLQYEDGGLKLPNFQLYYYAAQFRFLAQMFDLQTPPAWLKIETIEIQEKMPMDFLYKWDNKTIKNETDNPLIIQTVRIWYKIRKMFRLEGFLSPKTPLWGNRLLPKIFQSGNFRSWQEKGICRLEHCYEKKVFMSLQQLKEKFDLTNKDFLSYLQLRDFIRANQKGSWKLPSMSPVEEMCHASRPLYKIISRVYTALMSTLAINGMDSSRIKWEKDLGMSIERQLWNSLCREGLTSTLNARFRLVQFNFLHQLYVTPQKLHKYNSNISPLCFRCGMEEGTFLHATWHCSKLQGFWKGVCKMLSDIHAIMIPIDPEICLLGNFTNSNLKTVYDKKLTEILLAIAKKCITTKWKSDSPLSIKMWLSEINSCVTLEKLTYWMQNRSKTFYKIWQPFLSYMQNLPAHWIE